MIFNLFKSKPTLKELIPNGYIDIHSHILPGIDDGAKNIEESLELISEMKKLGFSKIIGTPHIYQGLFDNTNLSIKKSYNKLYNKTQDGIKINYAAEYLLDNTIISKSKNSKLLTIKDNYVLVELSFFSQPLNLNEIIFEATINGYILVLAHPERYRYFFDNMNDLTNLKKKGILFQANLLSLTDYYGKDVNRFLKKLMKLEMIDFFGSDFHNMNQIRYFKNYKKGISNSKVETIRKALENSQIFS